MQPQPVNPSASARESARESDGDDEALKLAQLMCSRLCHDLVGPMGGVSAGLELLAESGEGGASAAAREALDLLNMSAGQAARRISFFRLAFGVGGGAASMVPMQELQSAAAGFLSDASVDLDWDSGDPGMPDFVGSLPGNAAKLLLAMALLASGALPRGGRMVVDVVRLPEGLGLAVTALGAGATLKEDIQEALASDTPPDLMTARSVHAHLARRLAIVAGGMLEAEVGTDEVRLAALVTAAERTHRAAP